MDFDSLIPQHIRSMCQFDRLDVELHVRSTPVQGRWPQARLWLDGEIVCDQTVIDHAVISTKRRIDPSRTAVALALEYHGKGPNDTVVDDHGTILENQSMTITKLIINDIDLVRNRLIYVFGAYHMLLPQHKIDYYVANGLDTGPNHSLLMAENGAWRWDIPLPATKSFAQRMSPYEAHELWIGTELYSEVYQQISRVLDLQAQIKRKTSK